MYPVPAARPDAIPGLHREKTQVHQFAAARCFAPTVARPSIADNHQKKWSPSTHLDFPGRLRELRAIESSIAFHRVARPRQLQPGYDLHMAFDVGKDPGLLGTGFLPQHYQMQFWFGVHCEPPLSATVAGRGPR